MKIEQLCQTLKAYLSQFSIVRILLPLSSVLLYVCGGLCGVLCSLLYSEPGPRTLLGLRHLDLSAGLWAVGLPYLP